MNPLRKLSELGQSIWLDDIRRGFIKSGELKQLIEEDSLKGITSNPAIFQKAISDSSDYDDDLYRLKGRDVPPKEIIETLSVKDVQMAADVFRPVFDATGGVDGMVSLEVNPYLARDTDGTIQEARRLWQALDRPNVFIKVPGTAEGLPAIEQLISEGININITLLFGLPRYRKVAEAYMSGLERRLQQGESIEKIRSVASFFLSRIDLILEPRLKGISEKGGDQAGVAQQLRGQVAIASARSAYQIYKEMIASPRWHALASKGARPQRLLWASTSTKTAGESDVKYVEALIGPDTINTVPRETLDAYRDHGQPRATLDEHVGGARRTLEQLSALGINIDEVTQQLEDEGITKFCKPYDALVQKVQEELAAA